ncbi:DExH-box ATP-dependent RNA helicase DExH6 isoform X2 [Diospyros lotus]|nr:DExH-box ATP-dependent RNA helicase DExH6 isoform X2 [Diospyros lotus]
MGMTSKSSGRGNQRQVSIYKSKKKVDTMIGKENLTPFTFSEEAQKVLQDLFTQYPPEDRDLVDSIVAVHSGQTERLQEKRDDFFLKPLMNKDDIVKKLDWLASSVEKTPNLKQITQGRAQLPIASFRDVITSTIESNQVVLISGETGCGKTTQVPQFLLDYMWGKGEACKIVCTQPRRISAVSVAERISCERGENVGDSVGYKIRMESKGGRHSSIMFCTNGILLRVLVSGGTGGLKSGDSRKLARDNVSDLTHIIVDEIHERDRYSDFMLAIMRDMLPSYPQLRLVLMSATLDAERFSQYFGCCPVIRVPGFTYPVKTFYLEDVLKILRGENHLGSSLKDSALEDSELTEEYRIALDEAIDLAWSNDEFDTLLDLVSSEEISKVLNYQHSTSGVTPLMVVAGKGRVGDACMLLSFGADCHLQASDGTTALQWAERENQEEAAEVIKKHMEKALSNTKEEEALLDKYLSVSNPELVDVVLIEQLLRKICIDTEDGAILIFLPGWDDINRTRERILTSLYFKDSSKFLIISLHSMIPSVEQKKVFKRPPPGCRKIILSTNIAETAVTIDDVVYVIDSGRMKEKSYDPYSNVSTLQSSWTSKASAKQREGRAGRCQPGICYHLYSKFRAVSLPEFQVPEIRRIPIEEICLQVKLLDPNCEVEDFLSKTLDPPVSETIRNAVFVLQEIGALSLDGKLTEVGKKLGCLPVHPLIGKMLFLAVLLNCLDPALTLACASEYRDPFTLPMLPDEKKRAAAAKSQLASFFGGNSDQLAVVAAFECWKNAKASGLEGRFCSQYFVSSGTMSMLSRMRRQLQTELVRHGFIPNDVSSFSSNAHDPGILHAVLVCGLYPMVGRLCPPHKGGQRYIVETPSGDKVRLHPHSINFKLSSKKSKDRPLIVYDEITRGDGGLYIRNCSIVGPLPLLMQAKEIAVVPVEDADDKSDYNDSDEDESNEDITEWHEKSDAKYAEKIMSSPDNAVKVVVDRWLSYELTALDVAQIYCLRERLSAAVLFKVTFPGEVLPQFLSASVNAIACALSFDGLRGISAPLEPVDSSTPMVTEAGGRNHFLRSLLSGGVHQKHPPYHQNRTVTWNGQTRHDHSPSGSRYKVPQRRPEFGPAVWAPKGNSSKQQRGNQS